MRLLNNGGAGVAAIVNFFSGVFPMSGNWYPREYEYTNEFRRDMGMVALAERLFMIALTVVSMIFKSSHLIFNYASWMDWRNTFNLSYTGILSL